jgi:hypothetical protein
MNLSTKSLCQQFLIRVNTPKGHKSRQVDKFFQQVVHVNDYLSKIIEEIKRHYTTNNF